MARVKKLKSYTTTIRSQVQFTRWSGLKVSKTVLTRFRKGQYSAETFAKSLLKYNADKLSTYFEDPELRLRAIIKQANTPHDIEKLLLGNIRQGMYAANKGDLMKYSMSDIVRGTFSEEEINVMLNKLNESNLDFNSFIYNEETQRLEKVTKKGTYWIEINSSLRAYGDGTYPEDYVSYGFESK